MPTNDSYTGPERRLESRTPLRERRFMCYAVFSIVVGLKRASFTAICAALPYSRDSISDALQDLRSRKLVEHCKDARGEYWHMRKGASSKGVRTRPTKSG